MTTHSAPTMPRAHSWLPTVGRAIRASLLIPLVAAGVSAQLIGIKTVPIADGNQFQIYPSKNLGMAGVSIAVADTLLDPFANPAKAARVQRGVFHGSPALYSVSRDAGGGRTLPLGAIVRRGAWYGGLSLAVQEVDAARRDPPGFFGIGPVPAVDVRIDVAPPQPPPQVTASDRSRSNQYALVMAGRDLDRLGVSVAGSARYASLDAVDGTELLYANSFALGQAGDIVDLRLGLLKDWGPGRSLELLVLHNRFRMTHDVTYLDAIWDPGRRTFDTRPRIEHNADRTNVWGLHLEYERPLTADGWRVGWLATGNLQTHPKIPNYELMSIPRDPGRSHAYNLGVGLSRSVGPATFGIDAIYEPIWSHTWADAAEPTETASGGTIPAGGRTVENWFRFSNAILRMGTGHVLPIGELGTSSLGIQVGVGVHSIRYRLEQLDRVQNFRRFQNESWVEWSPTWGLSLAFPELEIRYTGRTTHGTGRPGVAPRFGGREGFVTTADAGGRSILLAPSGPLTLDRVSVTTHQVSLSLPIR